MTEENVAKVLLEMLKSKTTPCVVKRSCTKFDALLLLMRIAADEEQ